MWLSKQKHVFTFGETGVFRFGLFPLQPSLQRIMGQDQYNTVALDTEMDITSSGLEADEWKPFIPAMTPQLHIQYQQPCDASLYLVITVWNKLFYSPSKHSPRGGKSSLNGESLWRPYKNPFVTRAGDCLLCPTLPFFDSAIMMLGINRMVNGSVP